MYKVLANINASIKKWRYWVFDISLSVWKTPSYVRWIAPVNANSKGSQGSWLTWILLNQNFLSINQFQMINVPLNFTRMISPCRLITFGTKYLNKFIYTLVNLAYTLQNSLKFYFWFLTVINIVRGYLLQSERSALVVSIT